ncbi:hypothetical protein ESCOCK369M_21355 [Escherichia coli]
MLTKKKWALFSLLTLCGGTIYKLPSLKDAFYIPMQEYFHLTNGQIGNAMSVNSFVTTVGFFLSIYFALNLQSKCNKKRSTHQLEYNFVSTQKPLPNDEYFLPTFYNKRARKDNDFTRTGQKTSRNCQSTGT